MHVFIAWNAYVRRCSEFEHHFLHSEGRWHQCAGLITRLQVVQLQYWARASGSWARFAYSGKEERNIHRCLRGRGMAMSFYLYTCKHNIYFMQTLAKWELKPKDFVSYIRTQWQLIQPPKRQKQKRSLKPQTVHRMWKLSWSNIVDPKSILV